MCLTIPGRVVEIVEPMAGDRRATVDYGAERRSASLLYLPEAAVGDFVIVQAGFAIRRLAREEALEALAAAEEARSAGAFARTAGPAPGAISR
jgi:hydrogenase expression/formation protein HypC